MKAHWRSREAGLVIGHALAQDHVPGAATSQHASRLPKALEAQHIAARVSQQARAGLRYHLDDVIATAIGNDSCIDSVSSRRVPEFSWRHGCSTIGTHRLTAAANTTARTTGEGTVFRACRSEKARATTCGMGRRNFVFFM
jgi:hypothetical protein